MALQWTKAHIPLAGGMDESIDKRMLPVGKAASVINGRYDKRGAIVKRRGFARMDQRLSVSGDVPDARGLFSTGDELCIIGKRRLFAYHSARERWYDRGQLGPCIGDTVPVYRDQNTYRLGDLDKQGDYVMHAASAAYQSGPVQNTTTDQSLGIIARIETTDGHITQAPSMVRAFTATNADKYHSPRCAHTTDKLLLLVAKGIVNVGSALELHYLQWVTSTPNTIIGYVGQLHADMYNALENTRTYDAIGLDSVTGHGDWAYAYVSEGTTPDQLIAVYRKNPDGSTQANVTLEDDVPYYRVAISESPTTDHIYVLCVALNGEIGFKLMLYKLRAANLAIEWGPVEVDTCSASEFYDNLGVSEGNNGSMARVSCCCTVRDNTSTKAEMREKSTDADGGDLSVLLTSFNLNVRSRPFWQDNRCYVWADSALAWNDSAATEEFSGNATSPNPVEALDAAHVQSQWGAELFEYTAMFDLVVDATNPGVGGLDRTPILAGMYNIGTGPVFDTDAKVTRIGNGANVVNFGTGLYRHMGAAWSYLLDGQNRRYAAEEVRLDFTKAPLATKIPGGAAVIGGSFVTWYAGTWTEELGFASAPIFYVDDGVYPIDATTTAATTLADATYRYLATWETYDELGFLHRSMPCPPLEHTKASAGGEDSTKFKVKTLPATNRMDIPARQVAVILHRAGSDNIAKRITQPTRVVANVDSDHYTGEIRDIGQTQGPTLYTDGGLEIEAVMPEGARIPVVVNDRLWLGDLYRRSRVQYSKPVVPGSATETALAPEFNEGFGMLTPSGDEITGLAELDDKLLAFTASSVYVLSGSGPDDGGAGSDFSDLTIVSADAGCIEARSVVSYPEGAFFQSKRGIYQLSRGLQVQYIGAPVEDTVRDFPTITSAVVVPKQNEVRFTCTDAAGTDGRIIVYNYDEQKWSVWQLAGPGGGNVVLVGACMHKDTYHAVTSGGLVWQESDSTWYDDGSQFASMRIELSWLQGAQQSGWQRIKNVIALCESKDPHDFTIELRHDFEDGTSQSHTWTAAEVATLPLEHLRLRVARQKCTAIKAILYDGEATSTSTGEGYSVAGLTMELGIKKGAVQVPAKARG